MSRRFGRNQRRRAREEQSRLATALHSVSNTLAYTTKTAIERGRRLHSLSCEIDAAKAMLPEHSALMRPKALNVGGEKRGQVYMDPVFDTPAFDPLDASTQFEAVKYERVPLDVLLTDVVVDQVKRQLHARVQFAGLDLFYAISPKALQAIKDPDLVNRFTREIARQLAPALVRRLRASR